MALQPAGEGTWVTGVGGAHDPGGNPPTPPAAEAERGPLPQQGGPASGAPHETLARPPPPLRAGGPLDGDRADGGVQGP